MSSAAILDPQMYARLRDGCVIPAHPLALTTARTLDERRQRALTRYYLAAGAGGLAVGVHTTQFAIREAGLLQPVLELAAETASEADERPLLIAGVCGDTKQAIAEACMAKNQGYDLGLLSLAALPDATDDELINHCRAVGEVIPLFGFYLQPAVGGRSLTRSFWRRFAELPAAAAIKVAPFDRYKTIDVMRAVAEVDRGKEIALYTGNDDNIVLDLLSEYQFGEVRLRFVGGLLGHWAVWTRKAVELHQEIRSLQGAAPTQLLARAQQITDANAVLFDVDHAFAGCIPGIHEVLRRQGLLENIACLDPLETLSAGQAQELDRIQHSYPHLNDDVFVAKHRDEWLR